VKSNLLRTVLCFLFLLSCAGSLWSQEATTTRNVILRRDPSTSSPVLERLPKGSRTTLVDATPDSGFYHVRTEDDRVGWILARYVKIAPLPPPPNPPNPPNPPTPATGCDPSLAAHVYHPNRLIVHQQCIEVTGTIVDATGGAEPDGVRHEPDGDTHGWLKVDPEFQNLLNAGNMSAEDGNLVFEIVCKFPVTQADAKAACANYTDHTTIPPVGSHVRIVGTFVQDTFHAQWMEIHPVSSISVIP
jgi:SH3 domain-containing protein